MLIIQKYCCAFIFPAARRIWLETLIAFLLSPGRANSLRARACELFLKQKLLRVNLAGSLLHNAKQLT